MQSALPENNKMTNKCQTELVISASLQNIGTEPVRAICYACNPKGRQMRTVVTNRLKCSGIWCIILLFFLCPWVAVLMCCLARTPTADVFKQFYHQCPWCCAIVGTFEPKLTCKEVSGWSFTNCMLPIPAFKSSKYVVKRSFTRKKHLV